jgi:hypothetical protein
MVTKWRAIVLLLCGAAAACGGNSQTGPTGTSSGPKLTAPTPNAPADGAAVITFRPTLVVNNGSADQSGTRVYEFQVADRSDFSATVQSLGVSTAFAVAAHPVNVPEGSGGTTSYTPDFDLQPATRLYWRARMLQGTTVSDWTATRNFTTPVTGYSRPGELYDPLVYGATVGVAVGSTTFIAGKGIRLNDGNAYVRYQLAQPLDSGEFSMEVEGLSPNGPGGKLKVFSMSDGAGDLYRSNYLLNAQYRGIPGNPDNCIAFKALLGDPFFKLETDAGTRASAVMALNPARAYFWKGTWSNGFRLVVQDGINGPTLFNFGLTVADLGTTLTAIYNPNPHFAYLGANNGPFGEEDGSWPGAIYRNVWIGRGPRPQSLGSALLPPQ